MASTLVSGSNKSVAGKSKRTFELIVPASSTTISPLCVAFTGSCPTSGTYSPTAGTAAVYGFYTGTAPPANGTYANVPQAASMWIIVATGYALNASGQ